jgi:PAS domain-containing protein
LTEGVFLALYDPIGDFIRSNGKAEPRYLRGMMISAPTDRSASVQSQWLPVRLDDGVPSYLRSLLRQVEPFPAAVRDGRGQILACNRSYDGLFGLALVPPAGRNVYLLHPWPTAQRFQHQVVGSLWLSPYQLWTDPHPDGLAAIGFTPVDPATAAKLPTLRRLSPM